MTVVKISLELIHLYLTGKDFNNLTTIYLAQHTPTGTSVTVRLTDLDDCSDEHIKYLQVTEGYVIFPIIKEKSQLGIC